MSHKHKNWGRWETENYFDNEENILEWFQNTFEQQVLFPTENDECIENCIFVMNKKEIIEHNKYSISAKKQIYCRNAIAFCKDL